MDDRLTMYMANEMGERDPGRHNAAGGQLAEPQVASITDSGDSSWNRNMAGN